LFENFVTSGFPRTKMSIRSCSHRIFQNKYEIPCTTEEGSTFFGCWSVNKHDNLLVGPYSVHNFDFGT
jgi:hypothetical protein